jgi:hypothetical protein
MPSFEQPSPGFFVIRYQSGDDLAPNAQRALLTALEEASREHELRLLFLVGGSILSVDRSVPSWWLGVTARSELRIRKMAIASPSLAVRAAALGFGITNRIRQVKIDVEAFKDEGEARVWILAH